MNALRTSRLAALSLSQTRRFTVAGLLSAGLFLGAPSTAAGQALDCGYLYLDNVEAGEPEREGVASCAGGGVSFSTSAPSHGVLSDLRTVSIRGRTGQLLTYTAPAAYRGSDGFTVTARRGGEEASFAIPVVVKAPVNDPPECGFPVFAGFAPRVPLRFQAGKAVEGRLFRCFDEEHRPLTFSVVAPPAFGSISSIRPELFHSDPDFDYVRARSDGVFTLRPDAGYSGPDRVLLRVSDGVHCVNTLIGFVVKPASGSFPILPSRGCGLLVLPAGVGGGSTAAPARVSGKGAFVLPKHQIVCAGAGPACRVKISVTATARANFAKTLRIGKSSFRLAANKRRKVKARLSRKGRRWLKQAKTWRAKVKITVRRRSAPSAKKTIRVTLKAPK